MGTPDEMKRPAPQISDQLWEAFRPNVELTASMFINAGFKEDRKTSRTKDDVAQIAWTGLLELAYKAGLNRGYDMGYTIGHAVAIDQED